MTRIKNINKYKKEELRSSVQIPKKIWIKSVRDQVVILKKYFPRLRYQPTIQLLPQEANGWLVMPSFLSYNKATSKVMDILSENSPEFINIRSGELSKEYLRLSSKTIKALREFKEINKCGYITIPIQIGYKHVGRSPRRARTRFLKNEFGLGPYEVGCFLITNKNYLRRNKSPGIDCLGAEYGPYKHGYFKYILFFYFWNKKMRLDSRWIGCPDKRFGGATGFLTGSKSLKI